MSFRFARAHKIFQDYREQVKAETDNERKKLLVTTATAFGLLLCYLDKLDKALCERCGVLCDIAEADNDETDEYLLFQHMDKLAELAVLCGRVVEDVNETECGYIEARQVLFRYDALDSDKSSEWPSVQSDSEPRLGFLIEVGDMTHLCMAQEESGDYMAKVWTAIRAYYDHGRRLRCGPFGSGRPADVTAQEAARWFVRKCRIPVLTELLRRTVGAKRVGVSMISELQGQGFQVEVFHDDSSEPHIAVPLFLDDD